MPFRFSIRARLTLATLISLTHADVGPVVGVVSAPAMGRRWWAANGLGAFANGYPIRVSEVADIAEAQVCVTFSKGWDELGLTGQLVALQQQAYRARGFGDFWQHMLVAEGAVDLAIDAVGLQPYDLAAVMVVVEEAGGTFTDPRFRRRGLAQELGESLRLAEVRKVAPRPRFVFERGAIDMQTVQAVITNRYDVMARYAKSLKRAYAQERARLPELAAQRLAAVKRWLHQDAARVPEPARATLREALAQSKALHTLYEMREELAKIWERSNLSTDQLLAHLQDWCAKAEASGIEPLVRMSRRIRSYA